MKYMGSKRSLLANGLGKLIEKEASGKKRFVDLMTGSGCVAWFAAERTTLPVLASDLQRFAATLARSVIARTSPAECDTMNEKWLLPAEHTARTSEPTYSHMRDMFHERHLDECLIEDARAYCADQRGVITQAYGGHYFAPHQTIALDSLLQTVPQNEPARSLAIAATIVGASRYIAAPGHTAQPLQPSKAALPYLQRLWRVDPFEKTRAALSELSVRHAQHKGEAVVADANDLAEELGPYDIVFVDPPYSAVHYSRFYHVYETLAAGSCGEVSGVGRYPPLDERPRSEYSMKSTSKSAMERLLETLSSVGTTAIVTFPRDECSNGMSGNEIVEMARKSFKASTWVIEGRFSTLGGNGSNRASRLKSTELVILLRPC